MIRSIYVPLAFNNELIYLNVAFNYQITSLLHFLFPSVSSMDRVQKWETFVLKGGFEETVSTVGYNESSLVI